MLLKTKQKTCDAELKLKLCRTKRNRANNVRCLG